MRYCNRCKKYREDDSRQKDGKQPWCRECTTEYSHRWYEANREKHCEYVREHDKTPRKIHKCKVCGKGEPEVEFAIKKQGNRYYRRFLCRDCEVEYKKRFPRGKRSPEVSSDRAVRAALRRADRNNRATYIMRDSQRSDKKRGLDNDLDREFIEALIVRPCSYCAETQLMMTLDRIDNKRGHIKMNVVPACYRCNYFRRDMPYEAWMLLVPGLRKAQKLGMLDDWHCGTKKKRFASVAQEDEQRSFKSQDGASSASACTSLQP